MFVGGAFGGVADELLLLLLLFQKGAEGDVFEFLFQSGGDDGALLSHIGAADDVVEYLFQSGVFELLLPHPELLLPHPPLLFDEELEFFCPLRCIFNNLFFQFFLYSLEIM